MNDLKPDTIGMFKKFYTEFHELIDYRIKCGNVYEQAQAILIKSVAKGVSQIPQRPSSRKVCKTPI